MTALVGASLMLTVAAAWLSGLALMRLPRALDRLHAIAFLNAAAGVLVAVAALAADGVSGRSLKILFMMLALLASGAVLSHAAGRALLLREGREA